MSVVPSDLFPSIHSYLVSNGFEKSAKAFRKEVKYVSRSNILEDGRKVGLGG